MASIKAQSLLDSLAHMFMKKNKQMLQVIIFYIYLDSKAKKWQIFVLWVR